MALYIPQSILHLARSLYVRPETYGPTHVYFTVGGRHRGFVVLRNDWVFILMGVMEIWNTIYCCEVFLYIVGFVKI